MATSNLVLRTIYISPEVDDDLRIEAFDNRTSKNDLIRKYLELGMEAARRQNRDRGVAAKPAVKAVAKPALKKAAAKPAAKAAPKAAAKPVTKKVAVKVAAKPAAKKTATKQA
ncbi:hypothetical protein [Duganella hordei]|uniref:hypothetical protein n=1 Tax=Duganella hordei TaxID=2865934 RepID=UPI0030E7A988